MAEDTLECPHGMDRSWCAICKAPSVLPKKRNAVSKPAKAEHRVLAAEDYGLPEGTPFIDLFKKPYSFLSNFSRVDIEFDGTTYPTLEHAFQAAKTDVPAEREMIRGLGNPQWARNRGKTVTLRPGWDNVKLDVMRELLRQKFRHPKLAAQLLATGDAHLFEGNWWGDTHWGTVNGTGQNHLGRLLMAVRDELRAEAR